MSDVTRILNTIEQGDARAADELLPLVYEELRHLAAQKLAQEKPGQTLQATALVHEAYQQLLCHRNCYNLIPTTDMIRNDIDAPYTGMPQPVWLSRANPFGFDRSPAPFTFSIGLFLTQIISYHCLRAESLFKKLLPQDR